MQSLKTHRRRWGTALTVAVGVLLTGATGSASAAQLNATPSTFASVFQSAQGGDTILLAGGSYGTWSGGSKASMVTVKPAAGATVSLNIAFGASASNIRLDGIQSLGGWDINGSKNIEIVNSTFKSSMQVRGATSGIVFDNDTFHGLPQGTWEGRLSFGGGGGNAIVRNSSFGKGGCSDGIQLTGGASNVTIQNNTFTGIRQGSCTQHADPIQLYGASNIKVLSNYFYDNSTGIMSPDSNGSPITIKNNVWIMDEYPWAYVGGGTSDSTITHNVVIGGALNLTVGNQSSTSRNTVVRDNVSQVTVAGSGNSVDHNLAPSAVTFKGGSGRCAYQLSALSNGRNAASDGSDIGLNDCGATTPAPTPDPTPVPPPPPAPAPAPTAGYAYSPSSPRVGQQVAFDATAGSTCAATPCTYTWEDDGSDGAAGTQWSLGTAQKLNFTFSATGAKNVRLTVKDAQGRSTSTMKTITVTQATTPPPPPAPTPTPVPTPTPTPTPAPAPKGIVASFGFDEASGQTIRDASPSANNGTMSGATRASAGKHGGALSFDGVNDYASVPDAAPLDLTTAMTLEAWVYPTAGGKVWRTALIKETTDGLSYAMYVSDDQGLPAGFVNTGSELAATGTSALPLNTWSHLSTTWDGATSRLYVNGTLMKSRSTGSPLVTSGRPLKIGGNAIWNEFFKGMIDDVRVYNRALSAAEIKADMNASA